MEMPEGFNRFKKFINSVDQMKFSSGVYSVNQQIMFAFNGEVIDPNSILDLMKEMAEAIEIGINDGYYRLNKECWTSLNKFKEWK